MVAAPPMPPGAYPGPQFAPRGPEILVGGFNQKWLLNCLRRRWLLATLMGVLVGSGVAALLSWLFPVSSRITSYLEVKVEDSASPFNKDARPIGPLEIARQAAMHPALIKSPLVLQAALIRKDIADLDAVQYHKGEEVLWLLDELKVNFAAESPILEVAYEGEEKPEDMVKVVDAVVDAYKEKVLSQDRLIQSATRDDLNSALISIKSDLEQKLKDMQAKEKIKGAKSFVEVELPKIKADISLFQAQLIQIDKDLADIEVLKEVSLGQAQSQTLLEQAVQAEIDKDPSIAMYKEQLFQLDQAIQSLMASMKNAGSPQLKRLQGQYSQTKATMDAYRGKVQKEARDRLSKLPNDQLRAAVLEYNVRFQFLSAKKAELQEKLKAAEARIAEMSVVDPELEMLQQNIESQQLLVASLEQKIQEWDAMRRADEKRAMREGEGSEFEKVRTIQKALATEKINYYETWAIAGVGGLAALALTGYGVALWDFRRRKLNGADDMDEGLGIRVLGVLPSTSLKALGGNGLIATQVAEGIDNVRATIMHDSTSRPRQVVMVTSPGTMEGATTVAASLAMSLARAGRRTLLVDGDLRAPDLHKLFGLPLEDGLSEVLRAEVDLADAIRPTTNEGLHLLTAGVCDMDAVHALATDQPQAIFEKLRDQFDFIVIDAPPVLGISDTLSMGQYVDGAVLTVLRDHSEIRAIYHAIEVLRSMGVRVIGSVVNGMPTKADRRVVRLHQSSKQRTPRLPAKVVEE
jgi:capsular exopolysaccharide synthesis family protein